MPDALPRPPDPPSAEARRSLREALRCLVLAALLCVGGLPACALPYFRHAGTDLAQSVHLSLGATRVPGLYVAVRAPVFATSLGWMRRSVAVGNDYGYAHHWHQDAQGLLLGGHLVRGTFGRSTRGWDQGRAEDVYLDQSHTAILNLVALDARTASARHVLSLSKLEVEAHVLFVGLSVGLDFLELADFLIGLFAWDLLGDDDWEAHPLPAEETQQPAPSARASYQRTGGLAPRPGP